MAYRASGDDCALLADPAPRSRFLPQGQNILPQRDAGRDLLSQVKRIVLKCEEGRKMEHFGLCGGAERAAFITIATVDHTLIPYKNNWLKVPPVEKPKPTPGVWKRLRDYAKPPVTQWEKPPRREGQFAPGDFLLTVGGGCVVGFRLVECAVLINALVCGGGGDLVIEILPGEALETTSLQYIVQLGKYAGPRSLEYKLRVEIRINLERAIVPCTTRPRRPEDAKYGDYYFVEKDFFEECIQQRSMIDYGEFNGKCLSFLSFQFSTWGISSSVFV